MTTKAWRHGVFLLLAWCASVAWLRAAPATVDPLVGNWLYHDGNLVAFNADGTATHIGGGDAGTWEYLRNPEVQRHYRIIWEHGKFVDALVLSEDTQKARVHNEAGGHGDRYDVRRAIPDKPAAAAKGTPANDPLAGNWLWRGGGTATFNADGTMTAYGMKGTWTFLNNPEVERKYRLVWEQGKFIDEMVCSRDGQQAKVRNQYGDRFDVRRALDDGKAAHPFGSPAH